MCDFYAVNAEKLKAHVDTIHMIDESDNKVYGDAETQITTPCGLCNQSFNNLNEVKDHLKSVHSTVCQELIFWKKTQIWYFDEKSSTIVNLI